MRYPWGGNQSLGRMVITNPWAGHSNVWGRQSWGGGGGVKSRPSMKMSSVECTMCYNTFFVFRAPSTSARKRSKNSDPRNTCNQGP